MMKCMPAYPCICLLLFVTFHGQQVCAAYQARLPDDRQLVIPRRVRSDGSFVSHRIPYHVEGITSQRNRTAESPGDIVHYRLRIDHEEYHIELYPNDRLIGPGAVLEERRSSQPDFLANTRLKRLHDTRCHYRARVRNQTTTEDGALSTCYGLVGYIKTTRAWYMIEPVAEHDSAKETEQPHVVYRTRSPDEEFPTARDLCHVAYNTSRIIAKRASNEPTGKVVSAKRSETTARTYTVELLVVLDKSLLDHHRQLDVENYVLTLLNMAAGLFHDTSLGVRVQLTIVRIIRLEVQENEMNLSASRDADATLKRFQEWQRTMNPGDDAHPNHHDCAILISRLDICISPSLCGFTGTSAIAGTCDPLRGAAIVRDAGLPTGYHIAHQIGHTLGMYHDVARVNGCPGIVYHGNGHVETTVMHPGDMYITKKWSECSRRYLSSYIDVNVTVGQVSPNLGTSTIIRIARFRQGLAFCLEDEPQDHRFPITEMLPGVMYNGDDQCRLRYRPDARQCDTGITCEALKCAIPGWGCVSGRKPPAEGTPCGEKRWCYQMKCLMVGERPGVIDGGWGAWSSWSRCSRTCGSGVAYAVRRCDRPRPAGGGAYCVGKRKRHRICATNVCAIGAPSSRDVQCAEFNDWLFPEDGRVHRWTAYNLPEDLRASENPCALYCVSETNLVTSLRPRVVDGTTCYRGIRDICVGGVCREIPCDLDMGSNAVEDACGVCRGDSTSCTLKQGAASFAAQSRLRKVTDVLAGSRNIRVEETEPTKSRIVVRTKSKKTVLIDGNRLGMFDVPGSKAWLGMIRPRQEALNIPGPVAEDLVILVLPKENVTLKYSLGLKQRTPRRPAFLWGFVDWEKCSAGCGPGEQASRPRCVEKIGGLVDDKFCRNISRPDAKVRSCNQAPCLPRWIIGDWQGCAPCTPGCERTRAVKCARPAGNGEQDVDVIEDRHCQGPKPRETEPCEMARRRRAGDDGSDGKRRRKSSSVSARASSLARQNDFIEKTTLSGGGGGDDDIAADRHPSCRLSRAGRTGDPFDLRRSINTSGDVNVLPNVTANLIPPDGSTRDSYEIRRTDRARMEKRSDDKRLNDSRRIGRTDRIERGELVIDKEDTRNLTLTIILERDERNVVVNFPRDFQPRPPENVTEFTLHGMDALRYIQRIQEDARGPSIFRAQ